MGRDGEGREGTRRDRERRRGLGEGRRRNGEDQEGGTRGTRERNFFLPVLQDSIKIYKRGN
jgi:hypothetical protein